MNRISKVTITGLSTTLVAAVFGLSIPVFAAAESPFCSTIQTKVTAVTTDMTNLEGKVTAAWSQRDQTLAANPQKWDQEIQANRAKWDTQRQDNFAALEAKATTDAQKQAVKAYETTVLNAVTTRRAAYDTARAAFRSGVQNALTARHTTVTMQMNTFSSAVNTAISTAEASCTSTPSNGPAIRTTFQASLKSARTTFQANRKDDDKVATAVSQLAQTRSDGFKTADTAFQTTTSAARQTLKQAFGSASI